MAAKIASPSARRALKSLGANLKTARLKRRIALKDFAERIGVSESTLIRLEKGDEGVSIGALTMACLVLGELGRISDFLDPGSDDTGLLMDKEALPRRIDRKRGARPSAAPERGTSGDDDGGVGF
ncbi:MULTISPECIES: helix-turn-helix domain-containing protein [Hyphomonas]|nr:MULTISPECIES: helix-turn-helix transcriptional regulator [Hyphomonas]MBB41615.1 transcriptional regulator [Hyphomonas sp.]|tara:strand:- start:167 stop:541 length:375 start_codon:yes stop_codon:yes gene_type:complete